jgi:hypothetical protein
MQANYFVSLWGIIHLVNSFIYVRKPWIGWIILHIVSFLRKLSRSSRVYHTVHLQLYCNSSVLHDVVHLDKWVFITWIKEFLLQSILFITFVIVAVTIETHTSFIPSSKLQWRGKVLKHWSRQFNQPVNFSYFLPLSSSTPFVGCFRNISPFSCLLIGCQIAILILPHPLG